MLAEQDPIILEAAKTLYRVTEDERVRMHCEALEEGERTYRTLAMEISEQMQQLDDQRQQLQELQQDFRNKIQRKIAKGKSLEQIADELEENIETLRPLYNELISY